MNPDAVIFLRMFGIAVLLGGLAALALVVYASRELGQEIKAPALFAVFSITGEMVPNMYSFERASLATLLDDKKMMGKALLTDSISEISLGRYNALRRHAGLPKIEAVP